MLYLESTWILCLFCFLVTYLIIFIVVKQFYNLLWKVDCFCRTSASASRLLVSVCNLTLTVRPWRTYNVFNGLWWSSLASANHRQVCFGGGIPHRADFIVCYDRMIWRWLLKEGTYSLIGVVNHSGSLVYILSHSFTFDRGEDVTLWAEKSVHRSDRRLNPEPSEWEFNVLFQDQQVTK